MIKLSTFAQLRLHYSSANSVNLRGRCITEDWPRNTTPTFWAMREKVGVDPHLFPKRWCRKGEKAKFDADANIAGAQCDFQVKQAQFLAEVETQKATAAQAGPLSQAKAKQAVVMEEVRVERVRTQEQIAVQEQEVQRKQKELEATVIKAAEADGRRPFCVRKPRSRPPFWKRTAAQLNLLDELGRMIRDTSLCGLGQTAPNPVLTTMRHFRHEF